MDHSFEFCFDHCTGLSLWWNAHYSNPHRCSNLEKMRLKKGMLKIEKKYIRMLKKKTDFHAYVVQESARALFLTRVEFGQGPFPVRVKFG